MIKELTKLLKKVNIVGDILVISSAVCKKSLTKAQFKTFREKRKKIPNILSVYREYKKRNQNGHAETGE